MSDFVCMDWDLQAIVRGYCSTDHSSIDSVFTDSLQSCIFSPKFPDASETTTIFDELDELYKPFYPQTILTTTSSTSIMPKKLRKQQPNKLSDSSACNNNDHPVAQPKRSGCKKNQHKRVVQKVTAVDGLACDNWSWRKYGQKPIKGSPYPRSYYRCSSSKGCLARKQVERSSTDPGVFIITYSNAEHNHTHPTVRRNSGAKSNSNKASIMARGTAAMKEPLEGPTDHHQTPVMITSIEDQFVNQESIEREDREENELLVMPDNDMIFNDELFPSLEDLEGLLLDQFPDNSWFIDESVTLNGTGC